MTNKVVPIRKDQATKQFSPAFWRNNKWEYIPAAEHQGDVGLFQFAVRQAERRYAAGWIKEPV